MKTFALAAIASAATAFSTGHIGNAYVGDSWTDHSHQDHIYGYDSVPIKSSFRTGGTKYADNATALTNILTNVELANDARISYIKRVHERKAQRLQEIHTRNKREISAPFEYQIRLLAKESDDVIVAMTEATNDAADAFRDMLMRLEQLREDKEAGFDRELNQVNRAISRAVIDHKDSCAVLRAMRIDWLSNVVCESLTATNTATVIGTGASLWNYYVDNIFDAADRDATWRIYEGMFDDFHYDIGHGKGTGEGSVDAAPVNDGFRSGSLMASAPGDRQTSVGSPVRTTEMPRHRGGSF